MDMAVLRMKDIGPMDASAMSEKLGELHRELSIERSASMGVGAKANTGRIREIRRAIARIYTVATQKKLTVAPKMGKPPAPKGGAGTAGSAKKNEAKAAAKGGAGTAGSAAPKAAAKPAAKVEAKKPAAKADTDDFSAMVGDVKKE